MKQKLKHYWALVVLMIFANVLIFMFFSKRLEHYVMQDIIEARTIETI